MKKKKSNLDIAVIGLSGRFPGAGDIAQFWQNLKTGTESITFFTPAELIEAGIPQEQINNPAFVAAKGVMNDVEYFDSVFFNYTPAEAQIMEPQVRVFHECAWHALEDAGYDPGAYPGIIGMYAGYHPNLHWNVLGMVTDVKGIGELERTVYNSPFFTTLANYRFNLKGPAITLHTACSTSLVAIHLACRALLTGEADMALAGGVSIMLPQVGGYFYREGMIHSPDGHCRSFDKDADGAVPGEGVGFVVLKRLVKAQNDRDHIYAVVKGSAINNDGNRKVGYTAPSVEAQAAVIRSAWRVAGVEPDSVSYIEAHGSATILGDPIEIKALKQAFDQSSQWTTDNSDTGSKKICRIGSVKSNIGHLDTASGVAGFIKTVLALYHKMIPPSLHFRAANPGLDLDNSRFRINTELFPWNEGEKPLRAGVSSFGIGGTNAHVVLEEAPAEEEAVRDNMKDRSAFVLLSAKTGTALDEMTRRLGQYLKECPDPDIHDVAFTLQEGRKAFNLRRVVECVDTREAAEILSNPVGSRVKDFAVEAENRPVIFMFPGLGDQYTGMGWDVYREEPLFREAMDECFQRLNRLMNMDIKELLYPSSSNTDQKLSSDRIPNDTKELINPQNRPDKSFSGSPGGGFPEKNPLVADCIFSHFGIAQAVVFCFEYALARWLIGNGITPHAMIGYSFGEYIAACISGVLTLDEIIQLIVARGRLLSGSPGGGMVSVPMPREKVEPVLDAGVSLAIDNGDSCVVAGSTEAIAKLEEKLKQDRVMTMKIPATHGLHSHMMEPLIEPFSEITRRFAPAKPAIPFISNVTGKWMTDANAVNPLYWGRHLRETVRFAEGLETLMELPDAIWLEVGPGAALSTLVSHTAEKLDKTIDVVNLAPFPGQKGSGHDYLLKKISRVWMLGGSIKPGVFYPAGQQKRVPLPGYPFDRHRYPIDFSPLGALVAGKTGMGSDQLPVDPFYIPSWKAAPVLRPRFSQGQDYGCLMVMDRKGIGDTLADFLRKSGLTVITVEPGEEFETVDEHRFRVNLMDPSHYGLLFQSLASTDKPIGRIVHMVNISGPGYAEPVAPDYSWNNDETDPGVFSLFYLAEATARGGFTRMPRLIVLTDNMHDVTGSEDIFPLKAAVLGALRFIPKQVPGLECSSIDIDLPEPGTVKYQKLMHRLAGEVTAESGYPVTVYRGVNRMVRTVEPAALDIAEPGESLLKRNGVYIISNGASNAGLLVAGLLGQHLDAKLVLLVEPGFPPQEEWERDVDGHYGSPMFGGPIDALREIRKRNADLMVVDMDPADTEAMETLKNKVEAKWGTVAGVFHLGREPGSPMPPMMPGILFSNDIRAAYVLNHVFGPANGKNHFDFMVLGSLLASAVSGAPGVGQEEAEIQAVNTCFNAFAVKQNRNGDVLSTASYISLNWDFSLADEPDVLGLLDKAVNSGMSRILLTRQNLKQAVDSAGQAKRQPVPPVRETAPESAFLEAKSETAYCAPRNRAEQLLVECWQDVLGVKPVGIHDNFFQLGGDSLKGMNFVNHFQKLLGEIIHITIIFDAPTVAELAEYFARHYSEGFARMLGDEEKSAADAPRTEPVTKSPKQGITFEQVKAFERALPPPPPLVRLKKQGNQPMVFVFSPPRTGSTLLRVMLAGHPGLFAPPELNLLLFSTLQERKEILSGGASSHLQGTVRAIRQIRGCGLDEAEQLMADYENEGITVQEFYGKMQEWLGDRLLVDKSPGYAMNKSAMKRAEQYFDNPFYIHLLRHPYGMINSYLEARLDLLMGQHMMDVFSLDRREIAEMTWTVNVRNILSVLETVPRERQLIVRFEDMVTLPEETARTICTFLQVDYHPGMIAPYQDTTQRMTDGLHDTGIMLGDMKFHTHKKIDPAVATNWQKNIKEDFLGAPSLELARSLGYSTIG